MVKTVVFEYPLRIRERHLDTFGHVNNATYLEIYEEARWEIVNARGFGLKEVREKQQGPVILEVTLKFMKEMGLHQDVIIKTKSDSYQGKIGVLKQWIEDADGICYSTADFKVGLFDLRTRKLIDPTPDWLKAVGL